MLIIDYIYTLCVCVWITCSFTCSSRNMLRKLSLVFLFSSSSSCFSSSLWKWLLGSGVSPTRTRYTAHSHCLVFNQNSISNLNGFCIVFPLCLQVVEDVTEFYKQTYTNYRDTRQEALKETLRLIHFGVRTHTHTFIYLSSLLLLFKILNRI